MELSHFRKIKLDHSIFHFEFYHIHKIDGAMSHQKVCKKNKQVKSIFEMSKVVI